MMWYRGVLAAGMLAVSVAAVAPVHAETLKQALTSAYEHNPTITSALFNAQATAESIGLAAANLRPNLGLGISASDTFAPDPRTGSNALQNELSPVRLGLSYSQTLFDNGQTDARVLQARAVTQQAVEGLRLQEQTVLLNVVTAYMDVIQNTQLVALRSDNVKFYETQVKSAQDRLNLGEGTRIDVSQAQASLASGQALLAAARAALETSRATYEHWVGHPPRNLSSAYRLNGLVPATVEEALASADARHPQILAAKAAIAAAQYASKAADAAFGPNLSATGSLCGFGCSTPGTTTESFPGKPGFSGQIGISLNLPIYSGGRLGASARQANLQVIKSDLDARAARDTVHEQVVTAWATLQNANAQIRAAQAAVNAANLALQGQIQERDVGQATTLDVLNAEATLTTNKEQLISANATKVIATFTLIAAEGRLSAEDLALPAKVRSPEGYIVKASTVWRELRRFD